jgi:hypothetical protein
MRYLINKSKNEAKDDFRNSTVFALLPKKCFDVESRLEFIVWLETVKVTYRYDWNIKKWIIDHYYL